MTRNARQTTVLGIDLGTSSVKAVVARLDGSVAAQATTGYDVGNPRPGWSETAPADWLTSSATATAVRAAVARCGAEPAAIGLSGQMHGVVATRDDGGPARPAMLWSDVRATSESLLYRRLPPAARARLANPLSPGMAGPMLAWLAVHEPGAYAATHWALQPKDWLRAQLTGRFATEPSDASATLLYDVTADTWDIDVLAALGIDPAKLPAILPRSAAPAGTLTATAAARLGLPPGTPVAAGAADTAAAALGSGLTGPDSVQLTIGTGAQLVRPVAALPRPLSPEPVTHLYRAATWPELYSAAAGGPRVDDPFFLPHLNGERTPYLDPGLRGAWAGLGPRHDRRDLLRAALEGVAFAIREALEHVDPDGQVAHLRLAGGGTTDPAWRQLLADVLGRTLTPVGVPAASGLGAALLGARAAGLPEHFSPGAQDPRAATFPHTHDLYRERHQAFRRKVSALRHSDNDTAGSAGSAPRSVAPARG